MNTQFFHTNSVVVVLDDVLDIMGGVIVLSIFTLRGDAFMTML